MRHHLSRTRSRKRGRRSEVIDRKRAAYELFLDNLIEMKLAPVQNEIEVTFYDVSHVRENRPGDVMNDGSI